MRARFAVKLRVCQREGDDLDLLLEYLTNMQHSKILLMSAFRKLTPR